MTRKEFFEKIRSKNRSNETFVIELLKLRGFLFDDNPVNLVLSDNSHSLDEEYLLELLEKYNLGKIKDGRIEINDVDCTEFIQTEFRESNQIQIPSCWKNRSWQYFKNRIHGEKVAVRYLEPFIARYIKAISACCVLTVGSCDGNHPQGNRMYIMMDGEGSNSWHKLICEKCLAEKFDIDWINQYTAMKFSPMNRYNTYYEVNKAAEYVYSLRKEIRNIKNAAFQDISSSYLKHHSSEEIETKFVDIAAKLFDRSNL
ncbi:hypothetical protein [[Clostridium] aminophilum]|uniref:hypothetical protein n=1 Tax=[Clostridium] aminophilum TaxID=1526 RepID=UPI00331DBADA